MVYLSCTRTLNVHSAHHTCCKHSTPCHIGSYHHIGTLPCLGLPGEEEEDCQGRGGELIKIKGSEAQLNSIQPLLHDHSMKLMIKQEMMCLIAHTMNTTHIHNIHINKSVTYIPGTCKDSSFQHTQDTCTLQECRCSSL